MNPLTKVLVKDLLEAENKKITAIYGGGFKPPTKGHFDVVAKASEQNPEIDEFIIYVGGGVRDGIGQAESIMIWELYKKYLPLKVRVEAVKTPIGDILRYAKEHPEEKVLWVIGARENNPEDFADIASRTRTMDKYPNLELRVIQTSGGVSGTAARKAVRDNNKDQFFHLIPDIKEKNQVWDIVSPIITEGVINNIKTKLKKFISAVKQENRETKEALGLLIKSAKGDIDLTEEQKKQIGDQLKDVLKLVGLTAIATLPGGFIAAALIKLFKAEHLVTPSSMMTEVGEANLKPYKWEEIDQDGRTTYVTFITPSETKYFVDLTYTELDDPEDEDMSMEAMSVEFSAKPKGADGSSSKIVVNKGEMYTVMSTITDIIKHYLRKSRGDIKAILYSPSKKGNEEFGSQRDNLYKAFISKAFPGVTFSKQENYSIAYLPGNAIVAELVTDTEIICDNCGWEWKIADGGDDLYICHKCGHDNTPPQLNEGRYDSIARQLAKYTINGWKDDFQSGEPTGRVEFSIGPGKDFEYKDLEFEYKGVAVFAGIQNYTHNGYAKGGINGLVIKPAEVGATYAIPKSMLPQGWEEVYMDLTSTLRHEIEHLTQFGTNVKQGKEMASDWDERKQIDKEGDSVKYVTLPKEVDANVQGLYLKAKKWKRPYSEVVDEYIRDFMKITDPKDVKYIKDIYNKRAKELNLPSIQENDPFGINAYARELVNEALKDTWNPEETFVSLSKFMIDNGMKIQPLPKVRIISDDEKNASDFLGKTAYYNPNDKSITLYTKDRHPKDICRSFSHEMVHHEQNLDGRLNNINTTNTNEDGALPEIEREAYEKGNMMFRNWEDSIKNV